MVYASFTQSFITKAFDIKSNSFYRLIISCTIMTTLVHVLYHRKLSTYKRIVLNIKCLSFISFLSICVGVVSYTVKSNSASMIRSVKVSILDREGRSVGESSQSQGQITVPNANLWWPYSMITSANETAYLYTFKVV